MQSRWTTAMHTFKLSLHTCLHTVGKCILTYCILKSRGENLKWGEFHNKALLQTLISCQKINKITSSEEIFLTKFWCTFLVFNIFFYCSAAISYHLKSTLLAWDYPILKNISNTTDKFLCSNNEFTSLVYQICNTLYHQLLLQSISRIRYCTSAY